MTREEAIGILKHEMYEQWKYPLRAEALDMAIKSLSAQSEPYEDKLKEIADALSEKMCYMNTCPNERDIILGYLGRKRSSKNHCNTDCWNEKCESYHYETKQQAEPCEDAMNKIKDASFTGSDGLDYVETLVALDALKLVNSSSVQPERKKGKWKWNTYYHGGTDFSYSCARCGYGAPFDMKGGKVFQKKWDFCPNCGADMRGDE